MREQSLFHSGQGPNIHRNWQIWGIILKETGMNLKVYTSEYFYLAACIGKIGVPMISGRVQVNIY
jgi:hypothetical protein